MNIKEALKYVLLAPVLFILIFYAVLIGGAIFFPLLIWYGSWESPLRPFLTIIGFVLLSGLCAYISLKISYRIFKKKSLCDYKKIALIFGSVTFLGGCLIAQMASQYGSPIADAQYLLNGVEQGYSLSTMSASPAIFSVMFLPIALILSLVGYIFLRKKSTDM